MLNFSNHLEHIMLLIDSEKEANHPGLENRKRTPNICLLDTFHLVQILPDSIWTNQFWWWLYSWNMSTARGGESRNLYFAASEDDFDNNMMEASHDSEMDTSEMISGPRALRSSRFFSRFLMTFRRNIWRNI